MPPEVVYQHRRQHRQQQEQGNALPIGPVARLHPHQQQKRDQHRQNVEGLAQHHNNESCVGSPIGAQDQFEWQQDQP
ncbi:hypothetical protein SDC9_191133 [bioreactor metagenome]|uniref:Uncharacterized protein n=1 Tax=bioreactor metagenome TaxID=1076179 RepID=A0A645I819_9ZZZZ